MSPFGSNASISVLHVDDDPQVTALCKRQLEHHTEHITVTECQDPTHALDAFDSERFDCILSDFEMPELDGLEFLEAIRELDEHFPFIFFTGRGSEDVASEAISAGVTDYVTKRHGTGAYEMLANRIENAVESHRVRSELARSERRFRQVTENIDEVVWMADPHESRVLYVNPAYEEIWGQPVEDLYDDWSVFLDRIHPADRDRVADGLARMESGHHEEVFRVRRTDGTVRWVEVRGVPVREDDGSISHLVGVAKDITRYKEAVEERELLLDRITDGFVSLDPEWRFTYANEQAAELLCLPDSALQGSLLSDALPGIRETRFFAAFERAMADGESRTVEAYVDPLDSWMLAHVYPADDGLSVFFRDVTERRERETRFEAIFNNTYQFTGLMDLDGRLLEVNESFLAADDAAASPVGQPMAEAVDLTDDSRRTLQSGIETARNGDFYRDELSYRVDGDRRVADFSIRPIEDGRGSVIELLAEARDITERKHREDVLEALADVSHDMLRAPTRQEIHEVAVAAATDVFDRPDATSYGLGPDGSDLEPMAWWVEGTGEAAPEPSARPTEEIWRTVAAQEPAYRPQSGADGTEPSGAGARSEVIVPLGDHGALVVGEGEADAFGDADVDLLALLGTMVAAALDRVTGQSALRDRDRALEQVSDDVARLRAQTALGRETIRAIIETDDRSALERSVSEAFVGTELFDGLWIGALDPIDETVEPAVWRGIPDRCFKAETTGIVETHRDRVERAVETGSVVSIENVLEETTEPAARREALEHGLHSQVCVPLRSSDSGVGVLVGYASETGTYTPEIRSLLADVGEILGRRIQSLEHSRAVLTDTELAIELELVDPDCFYRRLAAATDATLTLDGAVSNGADITQFLTLSTDAGIVDAADVSGATVHVLTETDDATRVRVDIPGTNVISPLRDRNGTLRSLRATADRVRVAVGLPHGTDVRSLVDGYRRRFDSVELVSRTETGTQTTRTAVLETGALDRLTDRQREALLLAYHSGYFESPRRKTGEDLADAMGVSAPTFHGHLRAAQDRLFEAVLDATGAPSDE